jgi:hypothetical protein
MEMYSLRVSRDQKAAWDAYSEFIGIDTSVFVRVACDHAAAMNPDAFAVVYKALEKEAADAER